MSLYKSQAMLIDGSQESASIIRQRLHNRRIELVVWNQNGARWVEHYNEWQPALIFVDYLLAKKGGFDCLKRLQAVHSPSYIVLMHAFQGIFANQIEQRAFRMGASSVLHKPFTENRFDICIDRYEHAEKMTQKAKGP